MNLQSPAPGSSRQHVAFVLQGLGAGGSERIVNMVANRLAGMGWGVTVFAFEDPEAGSYYPYDKRVRLVALGEKSAAVGGIRAVSAVLKRISLLRKGFRADRPNLVVSFLTRTNIFSVLAARGLGVPVVVSERNNPVAQKVGPVWAKLRGFTYRRALGLITMTQGAMDCFPKAMRRREWVIPNPAIIPPEARELRPEGRNIVATGRLVDQKGFDLLLAAFAKISDRYPEWTLTIFGEGPDRAALEALREKLNLTARVLMPGVSDKPGGWISAADIFVLSSRFEGWGLVLGEAMAAGVPCISFNCAFGPAEMIAHERDGLLVKDGDVDALAAALDRMCGTAALRDMLGAEARVSMERFTEDKVLDRWEAAIRDALCVGESAIEVSSGRLGHRPEANEARA